MLWRWQKLWHCGRLKFGGKFYDGLILVTILLWRVMWQSSFHEKDNHILILVTIFLWRLVWQSFSEECDNLNSESRLLTNSALIVWWQEYIQYENLAFSHHHHQPLFTIHVTTPSSLSLWRPSFPHNCHAIIHLWLQTEDLKKMAEKKKEKEVCEDEVGKARL